MRRHKLILTEQIKVATSKEAARPHLGGGRTDRSPSKWLRQLFGLPLNKIPFIFYSRFVIFNQFTASI